MNISEDVRNAISRSLALMDAGDYQILKCQTLWESLAIAQKLKWYWFNRLTSKGKKVREAIDAQNKAIYASMTEEERQNEECLPETIAYPWWAEPSPKQVVVVRANLKLKTPISYIPISVQINDPEEAR